MSDNVVTVPGMLPVISVPSVRVETYMIIIYYRLPVNFQFHT